ncbi:MAG: hypothetical protein WBE26_07810 [Phycisphaerae bacterium]
MRHHVPGLEESLNLVERIDAKYGPVWHGRSSAERVALARYFLPHRSRKAVLAPSRPRIIKWYCPFAAQSDFPSGHRYCINVYTGCTHQCVYCYAQAYAPEKASKKQGFENLVVKDMEDLERFDVPPAPVHLSNSTDPFQPFEQQTGHTRFALERILQHRNRFTTVTILTRNPLLPVTRGYLDLLKALGPMPSDHPAQNEFEQRDRPGLVVEVSLAFWRESVRARYDPGAPSIEDRIEGVRALQAAKIPLVLRIDPLFPRSPLTEQRPQAFADFGLPEPQTLDDLENLVALAKELNVRHVVYSPAKITQPRGRKMSETMQAMRRVYESVAAPEKLVFRGGSRRLPHNIAQDRIVRPFLELCDRYGVIGKYCKQNLIETP